MRKAIIFDLDGTLLNTLTDLANGCNHALETLGLPTHPEESYKYFVGSGRDYLIRSALGEHLTQERFDQALALNDAYYSAHGQDVTAPYDGILPLLERLKEAGIACAVVSNKPHQFCQTLIPQYFGDLLFPAFGCVDGTPPKPAPHRVLEAMEVLGVSPQETVYVGDTSIDMKTAKNSGLTAIGVLWGFREAAELVESGADHLCETVDDLEALIKRL